VFSDKVDRVALMAIYQAEGQLKLHLIMRLVTAAGTHAQGALRSPDEPPGALKRSSFSAPYPRPRARPFLCAPQNPQTPLFSCCCEQGLDIASCQPRLAIGAALPWDIHTDPRLARAAAVPNVGLEH